ncbi:MAG: hypothetical protein OXG71_10020 [Rhodospirillales bacterium]|nr:hypothetical protein [Rhodospirillales bacterium]
MNRSLVRHLRETHVCPLNLCKFSIRDVTSRVFNDPMGDRFQIP